MLISAAHIRGGWTWPTQKAAEGCNGKEVLPASCCQHVLRYACIPCIKIVCHALQQSPLMLVTAALHLLWVRWLLLSERPGRLEQATNLTFLINFQLRQR